MPVVAFAILCGLLGEAVEVVRLQAGGVEALDWPLRASLFGAYGVAGGLALGALSVFLAQQRARHLAVAAFGFLLFLPWLNFDYLPSFFTFTTFSWSLLAAVVIGLLALGVARLPMLSSGAILVVALVANVPILHGSGRSSHAPPKTVATPPAFNVMLVLIDTLRADHIGAYGYDRATSEHFDELAKSSVLFEHAVSQAAWTKPATASLLTGAYVHHHGVISALSALATELPTLAETLQAQGLRTAGFSANPWITPEFQFDRGFDHFVSQHAMGPQLTNLYRLLARTQRYLRRSGLRVSLTDLVFWGAEENPTNSRRDEVLTDAVLDWLGKNGSEPFFVYVHLIGPHDPYDPPAELAEHFREPALQGKKVRVRPPARVQSIFETAEPLSPEDLAGLVAQYDGSIAFADSLLARISDGLEELGLLDDTLLIVTSDHGEEFFEHGNWRHGNQLYDEVVRVPLLMRLPGHLEPGRRRDPAMLIDVFPTVLGVLNRPVDGAAMDGVDLLADSDKASRPVFSEHWRFEGGRYVSRMVYQDGLKLEQTSDDVHGRERLALYDLRTDPAEQTDRLAEGDHIDAGRIDELKAKLAMFGGEAPRSPGEVGDVDRSTQERLHQLGY